MPVPEFPARMIERPVAIDRIMLDPNNPRLATLSIESLPEARIAEDTVQSATRRRLEEGRFDIPGLRNSIRRSGLLPLDRIVVREIDGQADEPEEERRVVVVEGNRRICAIKGLLEQHSSGTITLDPEVLATIDAPEVLVLVGEGSGQARLDQWVIQGVRHITGIREWGGYQAARTIQAMVDQLDYTENEVADALNLTMARVKRSRRVIAALEQMAEDEEYADHAIPDLYAYFDEMVKKPDLRNWVGWNNDTYKFEDESRARQFFSWISPDEELDDERRIPTAEAIRQLAPILASEGALAVLNTSGNDIQDALVIVAPEPAEFDWRPPLTRAVDALTKIPTDALEGLDEDDRALIGNLAALAARRLVQSQTLAAQPESGEPQAVPAPVVEPGEVTAAPE